MQARASCGHHSYGGYELAQITVQGIKDSHLSLAKPIEDDSKGFDPAHADWREIFACRPPEIHGQASAGRLSAGGFCWDWL